ncbi:MAG TPA: hypothetical protein VF457_13055 [Burkholderiaceae bacterium]
MTDTQQPAATPAEDHDPAITAHPFLQAAEAAAEDVPRFMREAGATVLGPIVSRIIVILVAVATVMLTAWIGYRVLSTPPVAQPEVTAPAPQQRQADGSVLAERAPPAAFRPLPPPPHLLPRGAHEERRERVVVAPAPAASTVEVDLSLVRQGDQRRVVASSPDGQVLQALDIPIDPAPLPPAPRPWAAGLSYRTDRAVGLWVDRDLGRMRLGAEIDRQSDGRVQAAVRVGIRF